MPRGRVRTWLVSSRRSSGESKHARHAASMPTRWDSFPERIQYIASVLRTSIRTPIPFWAGVHEARSARADSLIALANMERNFIGELALVRGIFELKGGPMAARGGPWEAELQNAPR